MSLRFLSSILSLLFLLPLLTAQQSDSPLTLGKDQLFEKSGTRNVVIQNTRNINTEHLDFSPAWYNGNLVFISSRQRGGFVDDKIGEKFFQMYMTRLDPNGIPVQAEPFSNELSSRFHEGPLCFSRNGQEIFFTSNNQKKGVQRADGSGRVSLKIYTAERGPNGWVNIRSLPFNLDEFSTMHPTLSHDGKRLYFSSDRPGGFGGNDIWYVERQGDNWSAPVNLGPKVNSEGNEVFPFIHFSGYLFYASDGLSEGMGGLDIYSVNTKELPATAPQMLPAPYNSPEDDFGLILADDGRRGFFSSNRPGGVGKDDIYQFEAARPLAGDMAQLLNEVTFFVQDEHTRHALSDVRMFFLEKDGFGSTAGELLYDLELSHKEQTGQLTLSLVRKKTLDLNSPHARTDPSGHATHYMTPGKDYLLLVEKPGYELLEMDYNSSDTPGQHSAQLSLKPRSCFNLEGVVKNQKTGEPIAKAAVLIESTELKAPIQMESDAQGRYAYCLPVATTYALTAEKHGYILGRNRVSTVDGDAAKTREVDLLLLPFSNTPSEKTPDPLAEGSVIVLDNLYYDYNKTTLRPGAIHELDVVYELMRRYPEMEIELSAHTDCRGSAPFNQRLSDARAESAKNYLISRGIQPNRISASGFGESRLRNHCQDGVACSEEEHAYNRRTEIRITKLNQPVQVMYGD
jgi:outer membrane protein OmpA-like peptidoglycan-associated protein